MSEPLALAGGAAPSQLEADPSRPTTDVRFADGSDVVLQSGAMVEVLENSGDRFVTVLRRGAATFDVHPGGPRRWVIESGHVFVEVVGTKFTVERSPGEVRVSVEHGIVVVRGEHVPDGVQRLTAGARLDVVETQAALAPTNAPTLGSPAPTTPPPSETATPAPTTAIAAPSAIATTSVTTSASADPVTVLLQHAETAQTNGDFDAAIADLRKVVSANAADTRTAVAAFTLARLLLPRAPGEAAHVLEAALARGMPHALEEDARARLVEAYARSGNAAAADSAAVDYLTRYPNGAHREEVERWRKAP